MQRIAPHKSTTAPFPFITLGIGKEFHVFAALVFLCLAGNMLCNAMLHDCRRLLLLLDIVNWIGKRGGGEWKWMLFA